MEDATVGGTRSSVVFNFTNKHVGGFSSLYLYNTDATAVPTEIGHIICGEDGGLNIGTNTAHPIRFSAIRHSGTRDVEMLQLDHKDRRALLVRRGQKDCRVSQVRGRRDCRASQGRRARRVLQDQHLTHQFMP